MMKAGLTFILNVRFVDRQGSFTRLFSVGPSAFSQPRSENEGGGMKDYHKIL